jgi:uncharacterized DUF497 family protein
VLGDIGMPHEGNSIDFHGFEWDANKNAINAKKHGIDFADALKVFSDPNVVVVDSKAMQQETRWLAIGSVDRLLITVVFTLREERIRIISARRSRISERRRYGN